MKTEPVCSRCGLEAKLYLFEWKDDEDELHKDLICWDCDWEISNGQGDMYDDSWEILADRKELEYEYDPINNPRP